MAESGSPRLIPEKLRRVLARRSREVELSSGKVGDHTPVDAEYISRSHDRRELNGIRRRLKNFKTIKDRKRADELITNKSKLIDNPIARFNMNLDGQSIDDEGRRFGDWVPTESRLPQPHPHESSESLQREMSHPVKLSDPETGQKFNVLLANWQQFENGQEKRTWLFLPPYNNAIDKGVTHYKIEELARQLDEPVFAVDHPGMGKSDKLTPGQKKALEDGRGYGEIAEAQLRMMSSLGIKELDLVGQSMGAFAAAEIAIRAKEHGIKVNNLVIVESPGVENFKGGQLRKRFIKEGKYLALEASTPYDPKEREAAGFHHPIRRAFDLYIRGAVSTLKNDRGFRYGNAMAEETLLDNLRQVLRVNPAIELTNVNGTLSGISPAHGNREMVNQLQADGYGDRVHHLIYPGEPHTVMESAKRFAALVKRATRSSSKVA